MTATASIDPDRPGTARADPGRADVRRAAAARAAARVPEGPVVAVIGGGITGLVAARRLAAAGATPLVFESSDRLGGAIRTRNLDGRAIDVGAEALFTGYPWGTALIDDLGLSGEVVGSTTGTPRVAVRGRLRPLPDGGVLGVPGSLSAVLASRTLGIAGLARAGLDLVLPASPPIEDPTVAELVGRRFGRQVVDRLVDPMVGGIHAGSVDELSAAATVAPVVRILSGKRSAYLALRRSLRQRPAPTGPAFVTLRGGLGRLVTAVAADLPAGTAHLRTPIAAVEPRPGGYRVTGGDGRVWATDGVVIATPGGVAADLLEPFAPAAAAAADSVACASVAVAIVRYDAAVAPRLPDTTGVLVPSAAGLTVKAATLLSTKWPHLGGPDRPVLVRASVGRAGGPDVLRRDDDALAATVVDDLARLLSVDDAPRAVHVERWADAMPQYTRGHHARMAAMDAALAAHPRLAVIGAPYRGVGVPACIREATAAADRLADAIAPTRRDDLAGSR